jgi:hypothetical protein
VNQHGTAAPLWPLDRIVIVADSVTLLDRSASGRLVVAGSHCGIYAAYLAARAGARAVILNDAGMGKDRAGIGGLAYLAQLGIPAAAVAHDSSRIGDGVDCMRRGVISHVNDVALVLGCQPGQTVVDCAAQLDWCAPVIAPRTTPRIEGRHALRRAGADSRIDVWAIDSVSLVRPADSGAIVLTGSHGALLGGLPASALAHQALAAVFNDAGGGIDAAGFTRLPALDARGIAAATVDAFSARIGDGRSTYDDGVISRVNATAERLGARAGMTARAFVDCIAAAASLAT